VRRGQCGSCGAQTTDHGRLQISSGDGISSKEGDDGNLGRGAMCEESAVLGERRQR
jgi:hypothetical protein